MVHGRMFRRLPFFHPIFVSSIVKLVNLLPPKNAKYFPAALSSPRLSWNIFANSSSSSRPLKSLKFSTIKGMERAWLQIRLGQDMSRPMVINCDEQIVL